MNVVFLAPAAHELRAAAEYYEHQTSGLGQLFTDNILNAIACVCQFPHAWPQFSQRTRRCLTEKFPYGIIYHIRNAHEILIVGVMHLHQSPVPWQRRRIRQ